MDISGKYPKLSNSDPLFEVADYTQVLSTALTPVAAGVVFANGWGNFATGYNGMKTKEIVGGVIFLNGMIKGGTLTDGVNVATITSAHRPNVMTYAPCIIRAGSGVNAQRPGMMSITTAGLVHIFGDLSSSSYVLINMTYSLIGG